MKIVSNASPLINLSRIGKIDLLYRLFGKLVIPGAVWNEIVVEGQGLPGADIVKSSSWISKSEVSNVPLVHTLRQELDAGEAEAIVLALEMKAELLLMDERLGRETAEHFGNSVFRAHRRIDRGEKPEFDRARKAISSRPSRRRRFPH